MTELVQKKCQPCEGMGQPYSVAKAKEQLTQVPDWILSVDGKSISRDYVMKNFMAAIDFINRIAQIAESEDHHPNLHLTGYRRLRIDLSTHAIGGLSENDFIVAAKINTLPAQLKA